MMLEEEDAKPFFLLIIVNEENPKQPEDADGLSSTSFFNQITIKNENKDDDDGGDCFGKMITAYITPH